MSNNRGQWLEFDLADKAIQHAQYERKTRILATWGELANSDELVKGLPVTFKDLGRSKGYARTDASGQSIPLVGGGELVLGQMIMEINDYEPIRRLIVSLTTANTRGEMTTASNLIIQKFDGGLCCLKPRTGDDKYDDEFAEGPTLNMLANFDPKRDINWEAVKGLDSPVARRIEKLWK